MTIEELVQKHGESNRHLIVDALAYLERFEPQWKLPRPINQDAFVAEVVRARSKKEAW